MKKTNMIISLLIMISLLLGSCGTSSIPTATDSTGETLMVSPELSESASTEDSGAAQSDNDQNISGILSIHFIDVGQADCTLIQLPNEEVMLIDAGNNGDADLIVSYLQSLNITTINYLVGTHPHEDHIGSLDSVINTFDIENIYMPKVTTTTKTFEDVLTAIENKGLEITTAKAGVEILNRPNFQADMVAPNSDTYSDLNNYSAVVKLTYGDTSFLFAGDAETESEEEMLANDYDLKCDVLKVGHHGSSSSTSEEFLTAVSPSFAVISCGLDNSYGHPNDSVLKRLIAIGCAVYRTDLQGTIVITSDGTDIAAAKDSLSQSEIQATAAASGIAIETQTDTDAQELTQTSTEVPATIVYITKTGEKYHADGCSSLSKSKIEISLDEVMDHGYSACRRCNPPS